MPENLKSLVARGEGLDLEFKTCRNQLNRDVYETVCAFLNRHGGTILLGIQDDGTVQGVEMDAVEQLRKDFVTAINNPQKLSPTTYLSINVEEIEAKKIGISTTAVDKNIKFLKEKKLLNRVGSAKSGHWKIL
ncbi:ATP-binding protein [bacterium]|nr:ATP-binding protein [bacterium]